MPALKKPPTVGEILEHTFPASVIDAMSYNFRTIVATDCVGDRAIAPHDANLFDMGQKYADLLTCEEIVAHISSAKPAII